MGESLSELLFAQHATGVGARQGNTGVSARKTSVPAMAIDKATMPGVSAPMGYWDPAGLLKDADDNKINYFRELEIKNGRVAMLAALGYLVAEKWHPFYMGEETGAFSGLKAFLSPEGQYGSTGTPLIKSKFSNPITPMFGFNELNAKYVVLITQLLAVAEMGLFSAIF